MTEVTYAERVAAGAALLDERLPGWRDRVDLPSLRLNSCRSCVLGQLNGGHFNAYAEQRNVLGITQPEAIGYGFDAEVAHDSDEVPAEYSALTAEWRRVITERRSA